MGAYFILNLFLGIFTMKDLIKEKKNLILKLFKDPLYVPMKEKELAILMQVSPDMRDVFKQCLNELLSEGKIEINKRGKYSLPVSKKLEGEFRQSAHGYGFVTVEGFDEDFYIAEKNTFNAMHGDTVLIETISDGRGKGSKFQGRSREAVIVDVLEHANDMVVGTYDATKNRFGFVIPDNTKIYSDIFIPIEHSMGATDGMKVVCQITDYGSANKSPEGKVTEILGHINDPGVDILSILKAYDVAGDFPEKVINQANRIENELSETDYNNRLDLRDTLMITIDGADSKDLDDAVSLEADGDNFFLGVHIADVTHYVKENSAIDKEALKRGTSVYPVDRVVPMLPTKLCNGICSLNEGVDRLALSCIMTINQKGEIIDHDIRMSVINSNHRMTYSDVDAMVTGGDKELIEKYSDIYEMLKDMYKVAALLREKRKKRGSIDFDVPETQIKLDKEGHPLSVGPYVRNDAMKLIEDFMLAANETVAEHFFWQELPFVYRIHTDPDVEKIRKLSTFIKNFGYGIKIKDDEIHPKELQKLLSNISDTPEEALISRLTLRSMQRAKYSIFCEGHFGLASKYYCHFTSPIRRYPDLQIHRIIKESLWGNLKGDRIEHYNKILPDVCVRSSSRERLADEAEREVDKLKMAEYMADHIGEVFEGVISSVTNWGIYVELPNTIEGLIHISKISGDYYSYHEDTYELVGEATGRRFALGDRIKVVVNGVDLALRAVDFVLFE